MTVWSYRTTHRMRHILPHRPEFQVFDERPFEPYVRYMFLIAQTLAVLLQFPCQGSIFCVVTGQSRSAPALKSRHG